MRSLISPCQLDRRRSPRHPHRPVQTGQNSEARAPEEEADDDVAGPVGPEVDAGKTNEQHEDSQQRLGHQPLRRTGGQTVATSQEVDEGSKEGGGKDGMAAGEGVAAGLHEGQGGVGAGSRRQFLESQVEKRRERRGSDKERDIDPAAGEDNCSRGGQGEPGEEDSLPACFIEGAGHGGELVSPPLGHLQQHPLVSREYPKGAGQGRQGQDCDQSSQ